MCFRKREIKYSFFRLKESAFFRGEPSDRGRLKKHHG